MAEYIERDKLYAQIRLASSKNALGETTIPFISGKEVISLIADAPAADVEPVRRGHWITSEITIDSGVTSCSCCHSEYYIGDLQALEGDNDFVMYCPNCGAKMEEYKSDIT